MPLSKRLRELNVKHLRKRPSKEIRASSSTTTNDQVAAHDSLRSWRDFTSPGSNVERLPAGDSSIASASDARDSSAVTVASQTSSEGHSSVLISTDLWDRAYEQLKDKNDHLVTQYENLLVRNLDIRHAAQSLVAASISPGMGPAASVLESSSMVLARLGTYQRHVQIKALLEEKIKQDEDEILKIHIGSGQIVVRDQVDKVIKIVAAAKDFVGAAVSPEPHAALAWTGVCVLLPLLLIPSEQRAANTTGLEEIADLIQYYNTVELLYREVFKNEIKSQTQTELETKIVDLYSLILDYQAKTICQLSSNVLGRNYGNSKSTWDNLLIKIQASHNLCKERLSLLDRFRLQQALDTQESRVNTQCSNLRSELELQRNEKLVTWLRLVDQRDIQAARQGKREPKTGRWLLEGSILREWLDGLTPLLWLNGGVGCGKSILCSSIVEELQSDNHPYTVAYFYSSWDNPASHNLSVILSCLLSQFAFDSRFVSRLETLKKKSEKRSLVSNDYLRVLLEVLSEFSSRTKFDTSDDDQEMSPIVLVLDALDEVPFGAQRDAVIQFLSDLAAAQLPCLRVLITSRRDIDIEDRLVIKGSYKSQEIPTLEVQQDIELFVNGQIARHPRLRGQSDKVKKTISEGLVRIADGMFQLASLQIEELQDKNQRTLRLVDVETTLKRLPRGLEESYKLILQRIQVQDQLLQECLVALKWLTFSKRPLCIEELVDACVLVPSGKWDSERRLDPMDLINNLVGLVTVRTSGGKRIASLAHLSVRDFLLPKKDEKAAWLDILSDFDEHLVHSFIAKSCLTYLAHCALAEDGRSDDYALRDYAWHWWASHAATSICSNDPLATPFALRLFNSLAFPILYSHDEESTKVDNTLHALLNQFKSVEHLALRNVIADPRFSYGSGKSLFILPSIQKQLQGGEMGRWEFVDGPHPMLRRLPEDPRSLRLLILHPPRAGVPFELLEGSLCMDFLENRPMYTALSYTSQGTVSGSIPENLDRRFSQPGMKAGYSVLRIYGEDFPLAPSLGAALLQLRQTERDRVLWIDALCVSMHAPDERSALTETQRMFDIYRSADEVAVWLGHGSASSKEAMLLLHNSSDTSVEESDVVAKEAGLVPEAVHTLDELFSRPIWRRSWVIQEIVCAKRLMLHCGHVSLDWDNMRDINDIYGDKESQFLPWYMPRDRKSSRSIQGPQEDSPRANASLLQRLRQEYRAGKRPELIELFYLARNHSCNRSEDKVFSLLSLLADADVASLRSIRFESTTIDYYSVATQFTIMKSQELEILSYAPPKAWEGEWPSWVPNWESLDTPFLDIRMYKADTGHVTKREISFRSPKPYGSSNPRLFLINGVVVGRLSRLRNVVKPSSLHQNFSFGIDLDSVRQAPRGQTGVEIYWRTVLADIRIGQDKTLRRIKKGLLSMDELEQLTEPHMRNRFRNQVLIQTENGYLGSTSSSPREGDLVILLAGGRTPFLVRRVDYTRYMDSVLRDSIYDSQVKPADCIPCRLIGQSYIHGIMDGEYFTNLDDDTSIVPKRFLIC